MMPVTCAITSRYGTDLSRSPKCRSISSHLDRANIERYSSNRPSLAETFHLPPFAAYSASLVIAAGLQNVLQEHAIQPSKSEAVELVILEHMPGLPKRTGDFCHA